jgi:DMSO/TMAO reductase YedYZ heme-binding membrane subunit
MMTSTILASTKLWWYVSRSAGIVGWALCATSVLWGMALATRALGRKPSAPWLLDLHRFLGGLAVTFVGVHMISLMLDPFVRFTIGDLLVPFASAQYKPGAVAWGIVAFYLLVAVEVTSLLKKRIPARLWRGVHLSSYGLYAFATVHLLTSGSDRFNPVLRGAVVASVGAVVFFSAYRFVGPGRAASIRSGKRRVPTAPSVGEDPTAL